MMFGSLVAMAMVQALARCPRWCFSYNDNWGNTPIHSGKKPFFADLVYIGLCNEPKVAGWRWLFAGKKIWKVEIYKIRHFWPIPSTSVLPAVQEKFTSWAVFLVHCIRGLLPFSLSPAKARKVKNRKIEMLASILFHASVNIQNCIGLRKKILELGLNISVRNSSAEAFVLQ